MFFLELRRNLGYILKLRRGWLFKTRVCSAKSGLLSSYDGHLRKLNYAWQDNTGAYGGEAGDRGSLSSCKSDIGIQIHFQKESGIVTIRSIEFRVPLEVSKGCDSPCPDEAEPYSFL